jgi:hypothetical protein
VSTAVEAEVALDASVVLGLGMTRAVGGAAGLAAAGAGALATMAQARAEERAEALRQAERYEGALLEVLDLNVRIAALTETIERSRNTQGMRLEVAPPAALPLTNQPVEELIAWRESTEAELSRAESQVAGALATATTGRLFPGVAGELRTDLDSPPPERAADRTASRAPDGWRAEIGRSVARVLARLHADARDADRVQVTEAAELVADASSSATAESRLTELRIRVQRANERARERRDGRSAAARFLRELATVAPVRPTDDSDLFAVRAALSDVVAGTRPLDDRLRSAAVGHLEAAQIDAERQYVMDAISAAFGEMGYEVGEGFETLTARDGAMVLSRGDWPRHAVRLRVDGRPAGAAQSAGARPAQPSAGARPAQPSAGARPAQPSAASPAADPATAEGAGAPAASPQVRLSMVRTEPAASAEERRLDVEREREWCEAFERARERLAGAGIQAEIRRRVEPGEQRLAVDPRGRRRPRRSKRSRERER